MSLYRFNPWHPWLCSNDDWFKWPTPSRLYDQHFGMGLFEKDPFYRETMEMMRSPFPMRSVQTDQTQVTDDKDKFQVIMDVSHFKPEELTVKTTENYVTVTGKHEDRLDDHGFVRREFCRRFTLPKNTDSTTLTSILTSQGILTIQTPKKAIAQESGQTEHQVPIQTTAAVESNQQKKK